MLDTIKILIEDVIQNPAVVLDENGNLLLQNSKSREFNFNCPIGNNFVNSISVSGKKEIKMLIDSALENSETLENKVELNYKNQILLWQVKVTKLLLDAKRYLLINFLPSKEDTEKSVLTLMFNEAEISEYLELEYISSILSKLKSSFPFTFIGRQKFLHDIDLIDEQIWIKDKEGKFLFVNKNFLELHNMKLNQIQNKTARDLFNSADAEIINIVDRYLMKTQKSVVFSLNVQKDSDASVKFIQIPLIDIDKNIVVIAGFSIKKSTIKDNDKNKIDFEKLLNLAEENSFIINHEKQLERYSASFSEILQKIYSQKFEEAFQKFDYEYLSKGINLLINSFQEKFLKENVISYENYSYDLLIRKILDGNNLIGFLGTIREKTIFKQQESEKEKMYDIIIHSSPQPIFMYDAENLKFLDVNQAALKMYGYLREEFLEMDLTDLYLPEDVQTIIENSAGNIISSDFSGPCRHKHKNGNIFFVEISKTVIEFSGRKAFFTIIRDVTKQIKNESALKRYEFALSNSAEIMISTDSDGFITDASEAAMSFFNFAKSDLNTKSFLSLIGDEDRAKINSEIFHSNINEVINIRAQLRIIDSPSQRGEIIAKPIMGFNKSIESFSIIIKPEKKPDIIIQKIPESSNISGLDASFLSNLFHELLTPINVMIGFIQDITESIENPTREQQESIDIIKENQQSLMQIIDNAIEFSNIEQNKIELNSERILFIDLLEGIEESIRKIARNKRVDFNYGKISSSLKFSNDKQRISTLISLLTRFGIQVTKKEKIFLSAYQKDDDKWIVSIRDDRNNISDELLESMQRILHDDENDLKHSFGISRFTIRLFRKLIVLLGGTPEIPKKYGEALEFGIVFPYDVSFEKLETSVEEIKPQPEFKAQVVEKLPLEVETKTNVIENKINIITEVKDEKKTEISLAQEEAVVEKDKAEETVQQAKPVFKDEEKVIASVTEIKNQPVINEVEIPIEKTKISLRDLSCLYIEDQVDSQILFKVQMKELKSIDFAPSFEKAIPLLQTKQFDFIVVDINLQGEYNGLDAMRAIQKMKGYEKIPIIAVTAYVLPGDRDRFIKAGFTNFITKPILKDKMENVLKLIFEK